MLIRLILFYVMLIRPMLYYLMLIRLILFYANYMIRWKSHKADPNVQYQLATHMRCPKECEG
jgi:hypothetical protein